MNVSEEVCGFFEGYTLERFVIISSFSLISFFGVLFNTILMLMFWRSLPSSVYLAGLATMDTLICFTYILLFGVDAGIMYLKDKTLFFLYHRYIVPVFFIAKVVQFAIPFILILITSERYIWTCKEKTRVLFAPVFNDFGRCAAFAILVVVSVTLRIPVLLATEVRQFPKCADYFRSESVSPAEWAVNSEAYYIFDFHVITAVQTCLPFILLLVLNAIIVKRLCAKKDEFSTIKPNFSSTAVERSGLASPRENYVLLEAGTKAIQESFTQGSSRGKKSQLRNAIYTMVAIVMSYLVCNGVHLFLTFLERTDSSILYESSDRNQSSNFYIGLSDTVSICYMLSSAIRIFIYAKCNPKLRKDICDYLKGTKPIIDDSQ